MKNGGARGKEWGDERMKAAAPDSGSVRPRRKFARASFRACVMSSCFLILLAVAHG